MNIVITDFVFASVVSVMLVVLGFSRGSNPRGIFKFSAILGLVLTVVIGITIFLWRFAFPGQRSDWAVNFVLAAYAGSVLIVLGAKKWRAFRRYLDREQVLEIEDHTLTISSSLF
jgi:hypothetical protein